MFLTQSSPLAQGSAPTEAAQHTTDTLIFVRRGRFGVSDDFDDSEEGDLDESDDEEDSDEGFDEEDRYDGALCGSAKDMHLLTLAWNLGISILRRSWLYGPDTTLFLRMPHVLRVARTGRLHRLPFSFPLPRRRGRRLRRGRRRGTHAGGTRRNRQRYTLRLPYTHTRSRRQSCFHPSAFDTPFCLCVTQDSPPAPCVTITVQECKTSAAESYEA